MEQQDKLREICMAARTAARDAAVSEQRSTALEKAADRIMAECDTIFEANIADIEAARDAGLPEGILDRMRVDRGNISVLCSALREVARLPDPLGTGTVRTGRRGYEIKRVKVPLGVVAFVYDCRPELTVRASALAIKSGNAAILCTKRYPATDIALIDALRRAAEEAGLDPALITRLDPEADGTPEALAGTRGLVDLVIAYGSREDVRRISEGAVVPVIEACPGNGHIYIDWPCDISQAVKAALSSKGGLARECDTPATTLLVHSQAAPEFLPAFGRAAQPYHLEYRGCPRTREYLPVAIPAVREDWAAECFGRILAIKVVDSIDEAIEHINTFGTGHSEAIITLSEPNARRFGREVDAAAVYVNAISRYSEGGEVEPGAQAGFSAQKFSFRGPVCLMTLTTDKYLIEGDGRPVAK
ncbi:MAG: glutamate-5-semialdehyde dehydrogenase [Eubacteriales bacterium]|jgi:glutamate-5-semialdehyde dehydrogenase